MRTEISESIEAETAAAKEYSNRQGDSDSTTIEIVANAAKSACLVVFIRGEPPKKNRRRQVEKVLYLSHLCHPPSWETPVLCTFRYAD
jgi:hypothetical protein